MRFGNHVAEFQGPAELAEAGAAVLYNPLLDLAVVRNLVDVESPDIQTTYRGTQSEYRPNRLYKAIPTLKELDQVVLDWASQYDEDPTHNLLLAKGGIHAVGRRAGFSTLHPDRTDEGPIAMSLRIDPNYALKRYFYGRKPLPDQAPFSYLSLLAMRFLNWGLSEVEQGPGDAVLFVNAPGSRTLHATKVPIAGGTRAWISSYGLNPNHSIQNANNR